ncbi:LysM peptidoglycan-binding domain-containing protein [Paenibacillus sp. BR2-3]|uniref:LysM peptidoglycan-binding domain-containing protein n=1 Tax=Paenibacillus sp. BR2-3 TaxID=3048494 RepID=UPI0039779BD0
MLKYSTYRSIYDKTPEVKSAGRSVASFKSFSRLFMQANLMKIMMIIMLVVSGFTVVGNVVASSTAPVKQEKRIVVERGDTLWEIALLHKPSDMRTAVYIEGIKQYSGLKDSYIQAGDILSLPIY